MDDQGTGKDAAAVSLGRRGGKKGGAARAAKLLPDERSAIAKLGSDARWPPVATHAGELKIGNLILPCYVLSDERRVFSQAGILAALNMSTGGEGNTNLGNDRLQRFILSRSIGRHISETLRTQVMDPFRFRLPKKDAEGDRLALGYEASVLVELCQAILRARDEKSLHHQQDAIARRADILIRGFAQVGVVALVDEATGFQYARARRALAEILEQFIAKELADWVKTFDDDYYLNLARLRGESVADIIKKRPPYYGTLTNNIVYERLAPGVLEELRKKNPRTEEGNRKAKHHQWLTPTFGHPKLREHLAKVTALMMINTDYAAFLQHLDYVAPRLNHNLQLFSPAQLHPGS